MSRIGYVAGNRMAHRQMASWTRRLLKKRSGPTKRASARSRTNAAKAASISRLLLALRIWICSPMARAAASTSVTWLVVDADWPD